MSVHLECREGTSRKFWQCRVEGTKAYISYGRIGTNGVTAIKEFPSGDDAQAFQSSMEQSKLRHGYKRKVEAPLEDLWSPLSAVPAPMSDVHRHTMSTISPQRALTPDNFSFKLRNISVDALLSRCKVPEAIISRFHEEEIDMESLLLLNDEDLKELQVPLGCRRKILHSLEVQEKRVVQVDKPHTRSQTADLMVEAEEEDSVTDRTNINNDNIISRPKRLKRSETEIIIQTLKERESGPLKDMVFALGKHLSMSKSELTRVIIDAGGSVEEVDHYSVQYFIGSRSVVDRDPVLLAELTSRGLPVVSEDFIQCRILAPEQVVNHEQFLLFKE